MSECKEIWKDIPGYENFYQVSNIGRVRSLDRYVVGNTGKHNSFRCGKVLTNNIGTTGYYRVNLTDPTTNKRTSRRVHRLVALAFIENPLNKKMINHIDGNKLNNKLENLEWVTRKENARHASETGLVASGESHGMSKLKKEDIIAIRSLSKRITQTQISLIYNVSDGHISSIISGKCWPNVKVVGD